MNLLYYGDNLDVLRRHVKDESVDLVYLDPPFNSARDYNVLFAERGAKAAAQIKAFEDTWEWNLDAERSYQETVESGGRVSDAMRAFRTLLGDSDMMAYLAMMAPRAVELRRVMKQAASIYLHCDSTASHYLKLLMDAVFDPRNFRAEIIWKRSAAHSDTKQGMRQPGRIHDSLLFYSRAESWIWNSLFLPYDQQYIDAHYYHVEKGTGRRFRKDNLTANKPGGDTSYEWKGVHPYKGRYWAYSREKMETFEAEGRLVYTKSGMPEYKRYLDEMPGVPLQDLWTDVDPINSQAQERLGYPTQKPEALLERIIGTSSNEGDTVLDPFCGCGTTIATAQKLKRRWIGIDITHLAIGLIKHRLLDSHGPEIAKMYEVHGEPVDLSGARELATNDKHEFQAWALGLVGARRDDQKKGADKGIDGRLVFHDEGTGGKSKDIVLSVKGGHLKATDLRDLRGVVDRERASIGVLISLEDTTGPMRKEAASAGFYVSPWDGGKYPRLQLRTVEELLAGKGIEYPAKTQTNVTYRKAPKAERQEQARLPLVAEGAPPYDNEDSN